MGGSCSLIRNYKMSAVGAAGSGAGVLCWICYNFAASSLKSVIRHIGVHSHDPNFTICGGCTRTYVNYHSFRKHIYQKHNDWDVQGIHEDGNRSYSENPIEMQESHHEWIDLNVVLCTTSNATKDCSAKFLLKATEVYKVSQTALDNFIPDISILFQEFFEAEMKRQLQNCGLSINDHQALYNMEAFDPFKGLHTRYLQEKYYVEQLGLIVSIFTFM